MASLELRAFLSSIDSRYVDHAHAIHRGEFANQAELAAADRTDLEELGIPKGAAGLIIAAAGGKGPSSLAPSSNISRTLLAAPRTMASKKEPSRLSDPGTVSRLDQPASTGWKAKHARCFGVK
ncbi:hypothetical protein ABBQ38_009866 [Trebouxia sp. C0009 RCD-2024]